MGTPEPRTVERIVGVNVDEYTSSARLADGRVISVPLVWFSRLTHPTLEQREKWKLRAAGFTGDRPSRRGTLAGGRQINGQSGRQQVCPQSPFCRPQ